MKDEDEPKASGEARYVRRLLIAIGVLAFVLAVFVLRDLLVLIFGSIVIAVLLTAMTDPIERWTGMKRGFALTLAILVLLAILGGAGTLFGHQASSQAQQLSQQVPAAWNQARDRLGQWGVQLPRLGGNGAQQQAGQAQQPPEGDEEQGDAAQQQARAQGSDGGAFGELGQGMIGRVGGFVMTVFSAIAHTLLVIAGGIYLAAQPGLYRSGILKLFPKPRRDTIADAYDQSGEALKLWLLGTLVSMATVGLLTGFGLWLIGVPSALALGLLAGLLEFVPIVGPIAASIPAILLAFSQSTEMALWTIGLFVVIQQLEGNVIQPIVQRYAVDLPPALLLFSVVAGGFLFGIVGVLFAAPLTVVTFVLVKRLYVREALGTPTSLPHET